ncbi:MAG: hypothetical protein IT440_02400 [Phycisphaeraceae bacterium]|nr:hypothetical protein [Phycisphaeraceae bacterium]
MAHTDEELKKAYRAFKKKLKTQQLDDDSRLGRSPLTGSRSNVIAIQPPSGLGAEVWRDLVAQGYLKSEGGGMFSLTPKHF